MNVEIPSLSASGWVGDVPEKLDKLLGYFLVSEKSQSFIFDGSVASFPAIIQNNTEQPMRLADETRSTLVTLLSRYFDGAEVDAEATTPDPDRPDLIDLSLDIRVLVNGQQYYAGRELSLINSKVAKIAEINNG